MKTLLAILLSFIVTEAPVLAIHGGYSLGSSGSVVGVYAGVFIPVEDKLISTGSNSADFGANSLGLFTLTIPGSGLGTGTIYLFSEGQELTGPIQAVPDPSNTTGITGVISATGEVASQAILVAATGAETIGTISQVTGQAGGGFTAITSQSQSTQSPTGTNLSGTANITVQTGSNGFITPTDQITYEVSGFQQSD